MLAGQISLFDAMDSGVQAPPPPMPDIEEYEMKLLLQMEREITGVYISGHPLDAYTEDLAKLKINAQFLEELTERKDSGMEYDQRTVQMGGLIVEKKLKASKAGNMMAFVQLEDMYGVTEVLVFPKVYERVSAQLTTDEPVLMTGKLSIREEEMPKLLLDRVVPLRGAVLERREEAPPVHRVRSSGYKLYLKLTADKREAVLKVLAETPGRIPVVLYMAEEKKAYQAPGEYWVDEGYDFGALAMLIGADNVVLK